MGVAWTAADREELAQRGIPLDEAERQIEALLRPRQAIDLVRPATRGDGIVTIPPGEVASLHARADRAAAAGRIVKFVPASGAASRMFKELLHFERGRGRTLSWNEVREQAERGEPNADALVNFVRHLERFPFFDRISAALGTRGHDPRRLAASGQFLPIVDALLGRHGLDFDAWPKGLLPFHSYAGDARTPFEEHLIEAAAYACDGAGRARLHFTVSVEHRAGFERLLAEVRERHEARCDCRYDVAFSSQEPSTDTLAVGADGQPFRGADGRLRFRPGGHGSLLYNLNDLGGDVIVIKNVDNVQPDDRKAAMVAWKKTLIGVLLRLQERAFSHVRAIAGSAPSAEAVAAAASFVERELGLDVAGTIPAVFEERRSWLVDRLQRPLRVCGMVQNTGEPGGGPFWVRGRDGTVGLQIVESAEVNSSDQRQKTILASSTHFNPVDLVCAVRDVDGEQFDLSRFLDPEAGMVSEKSEGGRALRALERPGLWNGAMARWNTVFVEVPLETFSPVKTVLDLLRPEHQPAP